MFRGRDSRCGCGCVIPLGCMKLGEEEEEEKKIILPCCQIFPSQLQSCIKLMKKKLERKRDLQISSGVGEEK